jgi:hypothetical protein
MISPVIPSIVIIIGLTYGLAMDYSTKGKVRGIKALANVNMRDLMKHDNLELYFAKEKEYLEMVQAFGTFCREDKPSPIDVRDAIIKLRHSPFFRDDCKEMFALLWYATGKKPMPELFTSEEMDDYLDVVLPLAEERSGCGNDRTYKELVLGFNRKLNFF